MSLGFLMNLITSTGQVFGKIDTDGNFMGDKKSLNEALGLLNQFGGITRGKSLSALSQDSIMQFPILMSADISSETMIDIAKALEKQYAAMLMCIISVHSNYNQAKFKDPAEYLSLFHSNNTIPNQLPGFKDALSSLPIIKEIHASISESTISGTYESMMKEVTSTIDEMVNMDRLNSKYIPTGTLTKLQMITESSNSRKWKSATLTAPDHPEGVAPYNPDWGRVDKRETPTDKLGKPLPAHEGPTAPQFTEKDSRQSMLDPTLLNVQLHAYRASGSNIGNITQNVVLGVKCLVHRLTPESLVTNLMTATMTSNPIFKFVKWTNGELSFAKDFILNVNELKADAITKDTASKWFASLKNRRKASSGFKFVGGSVPPTATIVCTSNEVEIIKDKTKIDLMVPEVVRNVMKKYHLLGFVVVDNANEMVSFMLDGYSAYNETSFRGVSSMAKQSTNTSDFKDMMKMLGRI